MKTIKLGKTGLEVSRVGIGGIPILRPPFDEAVKILQYALDLGFNFIDTSRVMAPVNALAGVLAARSVSARQWAVVEIV